jgi:hypothetical protein
MTRFSRPGPARARIVDLWPPADPEGGSSRTPFAPPPAPPGPDPCPPPPQSPHPVPGFCLRQQLVDDLVGGVPFQELPPAALQLPDEAPARLALGQVGPDRLRLGGTQVLGVVPDQQEPARAAHAAPPTHPGRPSRSPTAATRVCDKGGADRGSLFGGFLHTLA